MAVISCALALLSGVIGAGFASGREIARFFAVHGAMSAAAICCALVTLYALFVLLPRRMESCGAPSLQALCALRFGAAFARVCAALFFLLMSVCGGAMLAACAELAALMLPLREAYAYGIWLSLAAALALARFGADGLALPGACLCALLPVLMLRLLALPAGEACFLPAMTPDLPVRAAADGACYGALNAAMLCGAMPMLLRLDPRGRRRASALFCLLFGCLLSLGTAVCLRHRQAIALRSMPFVYLSRSLGAGGYLLLGLCMYTAAFSTLCAMLCGLMRMLPFGRAACCALSAFSCLLFAAAGFSDLVSGAYPVLGAVCAGLMLLCVTSAAHPPDSHPSGCPSPHTAPPPAAPVRQSDPDRGRYSV